jgi:hypothetical protein
VNRGEISPTGRNGIIFSAGVYFLHRLNFFMHSGQWTLMDTSDKGVPIVAIEGDGLVDMVHVKLVRGIKKRGGYFDQALYRFVGFIRLAKPDRARF